MKYRFYWKYEFMWWKEYRDYPRDKPLIKYPVESGKGIIGCQMNELNGWGNSLHRHDTKYRVEYHHRTDSKDH